MPAPQGRYEMGQEIGRDGGDHPEAERPGARRPPVRRLFDELAHLRQGAASPLQDLLAGRGHEDAAPAALEELHPEQLLELLDLGAQRGLGDVAGLRRPAEVQVVGHGHGVLELAEGRLHDKKRISESRWRAIASDGRGPFAPPCPPLGPCASCSGISPPDALLDRS